MSKKRIFISVANDEHKTFRAQLRDLLTRTKFFEVEVQPDFPHTTTDTVRKLDTLIVPCDLLIHIVGRAPGSRANGEAVLDFFEHTPQATFLSNQTKARTLLGDFSQLTYFQWEPWLALHRGIDVLVYGEPDHAAKDHPQRGHLDALYIARKHAEPLLPEETRCAQIVADVCQRFGIMSKSEPRIARTRLISRHTAADFVGREKELALLDDAWNPPPTKNQEQGTTNILSIIAWGGVGKTALLAYWVLSSFIAKNWLNAEGQPDPMAYFDWTFYDQGTRSADATHAGAASVGSFFQKALEHFGDPEPENPEKKVPRLAKRIQAQRSLLILDGLEPLQYPPNHPQAGEITDPDLRELLGLLAQRNPGLCLISSRQILTDLPSADTSPTRQHDLEELPLECAVSLLRKMQIIGTDEELQQAATDYFCHALSLIVLGRFLFVKGGDINLRKPINDFTSLRFEYRAENTDLHNFDPKISPTILAEKGSRWKSQLSANLTYDTRDTVYLPHKGERIEFQTYIAGGFLGGDTDIYGIDLTGTKYFTLPGDTILSLEGQVASVETWSGGDRVPIYDRLYLGGQNNLRGFRYRDVSPKDENNEPIGGKSLARFTAEYTFPIAESIRGAVFYDVGLVNSDAWAFSTNNLSSDVGIGVLLELPFVGPMRLDYGFPLQSEGESKSGKFNVNVGYKY